MNVTGTAVLRPLTLPADASERGVTAVAVTHVPSDVEVHECRDCGCVDLPDGVTSAAFVRSSRGADERGVARSLRDWLQSRRPESIVTVTEDDRRVINGVYESLSNGGGLGSIEVWDLGGDCNTLRDVLDGVENPVLRGTELFPEDVREVGAKIVTDAEVCEVTAVRQAALGESRGLMRGLIRNN